MLELTLVLALSSCLLERDLIAVDRCKFLLVIAMGVEHLQVVVTGR